MGNVVEFYVKMKDMMSSGLAKMASTAQSSFAKVTRTIQNTTKANHTLAMSYNQLRDRISEVEKRIQSSKSITYLQQAKRELAELQKMERTHQGNINSNRGGWLSRLGSGAKGLALAAGLSMTAGSAIAFGRDSVDKAMEFGATKKSFEVLSGDAGTGRRLAGDLNTLQQNTILGPEVFKSAKTLMSFGVEAKKVIDIEKQLGDVSMGNADRFQALTLAFAQTQSAGRLMGQDLLQYINAGFNPLQVMSERWKDFGLKQQTSIGQLKEMMEQGKVSSAAVAKAFQLATSSGGKFNNMMNAVAKTTYGRLQIMQGQFENFKIQVGESLMPIAESLINMASKTLDWLNLTKNTGQALQSEQIHLNNLVKSITALNEGNGSRKALLDELVARFPDLFGKIDTETIKNKELLATLNKVNLSYEKRIDLFNRQLKRDLLVKDRTQNVSMADHYAAVATYLEMGDYAGAKRESYFDDPLFTKNNKQDIWKYRKLEKEYRASANAYEAPIKSASITTVQQENSDLIKRAKRIATDSFFRDGIFYKDKKRSEEFADMYQQLTNSFGKEGILSYDFEKLRNIVYPSKATKEAALFTDGKAKKTKGSEATEGITSGGPRVININGVKFIENLTITPQTTEKGFNEIEPQLKEMYMRILNSGSKMQGG